MSLESKIYKKLRIEFGGKGSHNVEKGSVTYEGEYQTICIYFNVRSVSVRESDLDDLIEKLKLVRDNI